MKTLKKLLIILLTLSFIYLYCEEDINNILNNLFKESVSYKIEEVPEYSGKDYVKINNNIPYFNEEDKTTDCFSGWCI